MPREAPDRGATNRGATNRGATNRGATNRGLRNPDGTGDATDASPRARAFWSGTISFGLVSVPVDLYPANRSGRVSLRMLAPDGTPLRRRYFCPEDDREIPGDAIVRGYEIEKGEFVVVSDEELNSLAPEKTRDIDLQRFVDADAIDPIYFDRGYFLTPAGASTKAYRLLAATMEEEGKAGIATFVMRAKEYLVAILAEGGILRAETLRFADEVRDAADVGLPEPERPPAARVRAIGRAIRASEAARLDAAELEDRESERLLDRVERKRRAGENVVRPEAAEAEPETEVIDLMQVLKRSLSGAAAEAGGGSRAARRAGRSGGGRADRSDDGRADRSGDGRARRSGGGRADRSGAAALRDLTKAELYERAKRLEIPGRSGMSKADLVEAIRRSA